MTSHSDPPMTALRTPNIATAEEPCAFCGRTDIHNYIDCITILKREITRLESALADARRTAVDECARECDWLYDTLRVLSTDKSEHVKLFNDQSLVAIEECAKAIRALLPATTPVKRCRWVEEVGRYRTSCGLVIFPGKKPINSTTDRCDCGLPIEVEEGT